MLLKEKINLKYYLGLTIINFFLFIPQWHNDANHFYIYLAILASTIINHYFLFAGLRLLLQESIEVSYKKIKIFIFFVGKTAFLVTSFYVASRLLPKDVIYAVLLYIFQLIILVISIKKSVIQK